MSRRFDVVIIGAGNAGFGVASVLAEAGRSIAMVEGGQFGGVCPNRGCTPKKVLVAAAHALHEIDRARVHGIEVGPATLDWAALIDRKNDLIDGIPESMRKLAAKRGTVFEGHARFVNRDAVEVDGQRLEAEHVVVASGSVPRPLSMPGAEHLKTSDDVLSERSLPGEVVFIGGGVIALEFSHVYVRAGAAVTILEAMPRLLPALDADAVAQLHAESERLGITIETGVTVDRIDRDGERLRVSWQREGRSGMSAADRVVNGAGRVANVDGLDLDAGGVEHDGTRIAVDRYLRSVSNPAVWVCGDALTGAPQLSPMATREGQLVGRNIVNGPSEAPDYRVVPSAVYTVPALATVGLSEEAARQQGVDVEVKTSDMLDWFSARTYGETVAWAKVIAEKATGAIVGAHLVGHRGEELIHLFALAMANGIPASGLKGLLYGFPTFAADVKSLV